MNWLRHWLTSKERLILDIMALYDGPITGLQIVEMSKGEIARGTVYVRLAWLCDQGKVEHWVSEEGRHLYRLKKKTAP